MSESFIGQIQIFGFNFAPRNWAACNGQILSIQQNSALFAILGTTYGGNGTSTFALPNFQGRAPMHWGNGPAGNVVLGKMGGVESVTLTLDEMPAHTHQLNATNDLSNSGAPANNAYLAKTSGPPGTPYNNVATDTTLSPNAIGFAGNSQPHSNMQPYLTLNFCICLYGIFPSRN
jgi:microcystin-dependent protein